MSKTLLLQTALIIFLLLGGQSAHAAAAHLRKEIMNGIHLRATGFHFPPVFSIVNTPDGNYSLGGIGYSVQRLVSDFFHVTFSFVPVDGDRAQNVGIFSALIEKLENDEADFSAFAFEMTLDNLKRIQIMYPTAILDHVLMQPWPEEQSRLLAPIRPFTPQVWVGLIGAAILFVSFMSILGMVHNKRIRRTQNAGSEASGLHIMKKDSRRVKPFQEIVLTQIEYVVNIAMNQGNYIRYSSRTGIRLVVAGWLLSMVVVVYAYTGVLTAYLTVPKLEPTVDTIEELASSSRFKITLDKSRLFSKQIMNATSGPYKKLRDYILEDPSLLVSDTDQIVDNVINRRCVYRGSVDLTVAIIRADVKKNGKCRLTLATKTLGNYASFQSGMQKGNPYSKIIDNFLFIRMWDHGLFSFLQRQHFPGGNDCRVDAPKPRIAKPISLVDLTAPFFILGAGIILSGLLFLAENIYQSCQKKNLKKNDETK